LVTLSHVLNPNLHHNKRGGISYQDPIKFRVPLNSGYLFDIEIKRFSENKLKEVTL